MNRLRAQLLDKSGPYTDQTIMPFGRYKAEGVPLCDVPDEYLEWWLNQNPDWDVIYVEVLYSTFPKKAVARQKLKLHDYITERFNHE